MNWVLFFLLAYLCCSMQRGLMPLFEIGTIAPLLVLSLGVFVGLFAPRRTTIWAWGMLGFAMDMLSPVHTVASGEATVVLIGPYTFGMIAGGALLVQIRTSMLKTHPLSHAFAVGACGFAVQLTMVAILAVRNWYDPMIEFSAFSQLWAGVLVATYSAVFAVPIAWLLIRIAPAFGFQGFKLGRT